MNKIEKKRVKCANCGMIYDIYPETWLGQLNRGECPKCSSNAYDELGSNNIIKYSS